MIETVISESSSDIFIQYWWGRIYYIGIGSRHYCLFYQHHYRIFVISQDDNEVFNRAMLFNVGLSEAVKLSEWDCLDEAGAKYLLTRYQPDIARWGVGCVGDQAGEDIMVFCRYTMIKEITQTSQIQIVPSYYRPPKDSNGLMDLMDKFFLCNNYYYLYICYAPLCLTFPPGAKT